MQLHRATIFPVAIFADRRQAGRALALKLRLYAGRPDVIVLGIPRGGVPVAAEVARALRVPLDVFVVRKVGAPGQPELAVGAIASGGVEVWNPYAVATLGLTADGLSSLAAEEQPELERRERLYRGGRPLPDLHGKTVLLVDDGIATGSSMRAAIQAARRHQAWRIVVAAPVVAPASRRELEEEDGVAVVALAEPDSFYAVGQFYREFPQVSDEEVQTLLRQSAEPSSPAA
jgi:putative phosphoribosyl transferase